MQAPDELFELIEEYLGGLELAPELGSQRDSMRYALEGGKRIRAVICLATAEAAGAEPGDALPAAAALELVHAFSLVHDDLPALDDDDERRGRASAHVAFGEGVALLAGDALLAEAFRLALTYPSARAGTRARRRHARDDRRPVPRHHRCRRGSRRAAPAQDGTGCSSRPSVSGSRWRRSRPPSRHPGARSARSSALLFQVVDDVLDGDGYAARLGVEAARDARPRGGRARAARALESIPADTSVLAAIVDALVVRTA